MTRHRLALAAVAAFTASIAPLLVAGVATATGCPAGAQTEVAGGWTRIAAPRFGAGPQQVVAYAVRGTRPTDLYATNGTALARSVDGGCHWADTYTIGTLPSPTSPFTATTAHIGTIAAPGPGSVLAVVTQGPALYVLRSQDAGTTWTASSAGPVQPDATAADAKIVPAPGGALYLLAGVTPTTRGGAGRLVYTSVDGGASWSASNIPATLLASSPGTAPRLTDLAVSPADGGLLYAATTVGLFRSTDGGATWNGADVGGGSPVDAVTASRGPHGVSVVAVDNADLAAYVSTDAGQNWSAVNLPGEVGSAALNPRQDTAAVATPQGVFQVQLDTVGITWMWSGRPRLSGVTLDSTAAPYVYACSCGDQTPPAIWRKRDLVPAGNLQFAPPPPPIVVPGVGDDDYKCQGALPAVNRPRDWGTSSVAPARRTLTLAPGQSVTVPYRVQAAPKRFEVYYLAESGAKMEFGLCPFEYGAVVASNALLGVRDLRVGLGDFRDYPGQADEEWGSGGPTGSGFTYLRRVSMGLPGDTLTNGLPSMSWRLGPDASAASAMYQAVTGRGQDLAPAGPSLDDIVGGQQANFGGTSYKVLMLVTGKWFNAPERSAGYPGVPIQTALDALKQRGVKQVGIWVNNTGNKQSQGNQRYEGRIDMHRFARETGAVSEKNLDCNEDGYVDLGPGEPLVCDWLSLDTASNGTYQTLGDPSLGKEMLKLLLSLRDPQPLRLVATRGAAAVSAVGPASYAAVDRLTPSTHDFQVTFHCGPKQTNNAVPVTLSGQAGAETLATAQVLLQCGGPVAPRSHPAALVLPPPPPVPPVPNPLPNPGPVPNPNPVPAPAANPAPAGQAQAQAQPVAQGAVVPQEQAQPQLAFERASNALQGEEPMSALPERDPLRRARQVALGGGAALMLAFCSLNVALGRSEERRRR
jgi:hypothetical protein